MPAFGLAPAFESALASRPSNKSAREGQAPVRYDLIFIGAGLICLLVGEAMGIHMGISQDFTLTPSHAHLNLLGWVTLALYGLVHRAYPGLGGKWLARVQCVIAIAGSVMMPWGIAQGVLHQDFTFAKLGALVVTLGTVLFLIMFGLKAFAKEAAQ